jgi:hypothetical protein
MTPIFGRGWRRLLQYAAFFLVLPLLPILVLGRILFFATIDFCVVLRAWWRRPDPEISQESSKEPVLPFWLAWLMALALVAAAIATTLWGFALAGDIAGPAQLIVQSLIVLIALGLLLSAYRAALSGSRALQRALVHNFALLIAYELDWLRGEAERQTALLDIGRGLAPLHVSSLEIRVPGCLEDREEIRNIFGTPTEEALSHLLASLKAYNMALAIGIADTAQSPGADMAARLAAVHLHLRRAFQILGPHLRPGLNGSESEAAT